MTAERDNDETRVPPDGSDGDETVLRSEIDAETPAPGAPADATALEPGSDATAIHPDADATALEPGSDATAIHPDADATALGALPDSESTRADDRLPRTEGRFRLLRPIGTGGMGEVFEAEQLEPVRRTVAFKVIKPGMDSEEIVSRFESERQALALMDHPSIARVFDAGKTDRGRPFFAMEYIDGKPLSDFCDEAKMPLRERLELFIAVCEGVQHAHQKAVIHRDLKPSNVLVTRQDGRAVPKIIDFGIAKALGDPLSDTAMQTQMGHLVGTPDYMSPEQAELGAGAIDTRTDVYSLGVMLYVMLVGALPFDPKALRESGLRGILQTIREVEPPTPSSRLGTLGGDSSPAAEARGLDSGQLIRFVRGDLDWIAMKAIEKERDRRYGSAAQLAADVRRFLDDEPVLARPPSRLYKAGKFVKRHRLGVASAATVVTLLVVLAVAMTVQAGLIADERDRANQEAELARQVSDFVVGLFEVSDPSESLGNTITARELLDDGAERIRSELVEQPAVQAHLMDTIGWVYKGLGLYDEARPLIEESLQTLETRIGSDDSRLAEPLEHLAVVHMIEGEYDEARPLFERALDILQREKGPDHADVASVLNNMGTLAWRSGDNDEARALYARSLEIFRVENGESSEQFAAVMGNLGIVHWREGDYEGARERFARSVEILLEVHGEFHPDVAQSLHNQALVEQRLEQYVEAQGTMARVISIREKVLGPTHLKLATSLYNLGNLYLRTYSWEPALRAHRRALDIRAEALSGSHPDVAQSLDGLAIAEKELGRLVSAEEKFDRARVIRESVYESSHRRVATSYYNLAGIAALRGDSDRALALLGNAVDRGYANLEHLIDDGDFDADLRSDPRFAALVASVEAAAKGD